MAQITRQLWSALRDEAILASGGHTYTGYSGRLQYWMTEAYYDLCAMYHHYELDGEKIIALTVNTYKVDLPSDCFIVVGVGLLDASDQPVKFLRYEHFRLHAPGIRPVQADLISYSRYQNAIYFNAWAKPNTRIKLYYYRNPNAPDFAGTSGQPNSVPEIQWKWDSHLIDSTVARAQRRIWRPDLGQFNAQSLSEWLEAQVQAQTKDQPVGATPARPLANEAIGGAQK